MREFRKRRAELVRQLCWLVGARLASPFPTSWSPQVRYRSSQQRESAMGTLSGRSGRRDAAFSPSAGIRLSMVPGRPVWPGWWNRWRGDVAVRVAGASWRMGSY